ncbi:MAG: DHH family phosphoesterase [Patescibacteria group bacterium]
MSKILITAKIGQDLDGVACAYAYAAFLNSTDKKNEYVAGIYGEPHIEARYVLEQLTITSGLVYNPETEFDKFILVDASELKGMSEVIRAEDVIEVIDHRETHRAPELFPQAKIQIEKVGAAATLIFEKIKQQKLPLDKNSVFLLLGAIYSNTLNFQSDVANERDRAAVEALENDYGVKIPPDFISKMFLYKTEYIKEHLEESIISDFKNFDNGIGIAQLEGFNLNKIVEKKIEEIKTVLIELKEKYQLKYIFLNAADIKKNYNIFVAIDEETRALLSASLTLTFNENQIAKNNKLLLRKQILPLLLKTLKL